LLLHTPTLLFVTALVIAFSGILLIFAQGKQRDTGPMGVWGVAMLLGALGLVLLMFDKGSLWISEGLGNAMALAATATSWTAARIFAERHLRLWLAAAGPALWLATIPVHTVSAWWTALASAIGAAYTLATAAELWCTRAEYLPSRAPALFLLLMHVMVYAARAVGVLVGGNGGSWADLITNVLTVESLLQTVGMAFLLLSMMKERVELRSSERLRALALRDGLTGVGNRRHFDKQLDVEIRRARRVRMTVALLLIDVDHFKSFNDAFGHQQGDLCLQAVAKTIAAVVGRPGDLTARYGGEEFAVLLPETDLTGAWELAEAMRVSVRALEFKHSAGLGLVTISIGLAVVLPRQEQDTGKALVLAADRALYEAKATGRDKVCSAPIAPSTGN